MRERKWAKLFFSKEEKQIFSPPAFFTPLPSNVPPQTTVAWVPHSSWQSILLYVTARFTYCVIPKKSFLSPHPMLIVNSYPFLLIRSALFLPLTLLAHKILGRKMQHHRRLFWRNVELGFILLLHSPKHYRHQSSFRDHWISWYLYFPKQPAAGESVRCCVESNTIRLLYHSVHTIIKSIPKIRWLLLIFFLSSQM